MKLKDIVEVVVNNKECVVLKVKPNQTFNLISLGCFNGDETMMRLTKGERTCTIWTGEKHYSWDCGTLVCDSMIKQRFMLYDTLKELGITF